MPASLQFAWAASRPALALAATVVLVAWAAVGTAAVRDYEVRAGDSLWSIARAHGCTVNEILLANPGRAEGARLRPGDRLNVPECGGGRATTAATPQGRSGGLADPCGWSEREIRKGVLDELMKHLGFKPPPRFRAMIVRLELSRDRSRVVSREVFDHGGLATRVDGWNPASTIKLYAAVSALERLHGLGFGPSAKVTFHYPRGDKTFLVEQLFEESVHKSDNIAHNRLVQLAGFDGLNGPRGTLRRAGLHQSAIMRAYAASQWEAEGHEKSLRASPRITLRQWAGRGKRARKNTLPAAVGAAKTDCHGAACTSLSDLGRMMCRLMLHEQLPASRRLHLGTGERQGPMLKFLRQRLNRSRDANDPVWQALERHLIPKDQRGKPTRGGYQLFRKAGFSQDWRSDNFYVYQPHSRVRWIVVMAGYPGRGALDEAADVIARIVKGDLVSKPPRKAPPKRRRATRSGAAGTGP